MTVAYPHTHELVRQIKEDGKRLIRELEGISPESVRGLIVRDKLLQIRDTLEAFELSGIQVRP